MRVSLLLVLVLACLVLSSAGCATDMLWEPYGLDLVDDDFFYPFNSGHVDMDTYGLEPDSQYWFNTPWIDLTLRSLLTPFALAFDATTFVFYCMHLHMHWGPVTYHL